MLLMPLQQMSLNPKISKVTSLPRGDPTVCTCGRVCYGGISWEEVRNGARGSALETQPLIPAIPLAWAEVRLWPHSSGGCQALGFFHGEKRNAIGPKGCSWRDSFFLQSLSSVIWPVVGWADSGEGEEAVLSFSGIRDGHTPQRSIWAAVF